MSIYYWLELKYHWQDHYFLCTKWDVEQIIWCVLFNSRCPPGFTGAICDQSSKFFLLYRVWKRDSDWAQTACMKAPNKHHLFKAWSNESLWTKTQFVNMQITADLCMTWWMFIQFSIKTPFTSNVSTKASHSGLFRNILVHSLVFTFCFRVYWESFCQISF